MELDVVLSGVVLSAMLYQGGLGEVACRKKGGHKWSRCAKGGVMKCHVVQKGVA